jgi:translation initiation factor 2 beta subunit (eIF-2beta)/eIF-5
MNMNNIMSDLIKKYQKELVLCEAENNPDNEKIRVCNDYSTRSCLACNTCWMK